jgi:Fructose-1-6-bisphosphatase, C-terminal domain
LPVAFLIEKAGGITSDGDKSVLDIVIKGSKQKSSFVAGSANDVQFIIQQVKEEEAQEHTRMKELGMLGSGKIAPSSAVTAATE